MEKSGSYSYKLGDNNYQIDNDSNFWKSFSHKANKDL
jgi:hypothetical protein